MASLKPLYTRDNCAFAYQLNWGLAVFWRMPAEDDPWLDELADALEPDGIRLLRHRFTKPGASQFHVSTKPHVAPETLVARVKGRLQYLVRKQWPRAFKRNYCLDSVGSATRHVVERYVESQFEKHGMANPDFQRFLENLRIRRPEADLSPYRRTARALFRYNLHLVLETEPEWAEPRRRQLVKVRDQLLRIAEARSHLLSRATIIPDHLHVTLGCPFDVAPADIAICYLNNLAYLYGMQAVYRFSAYVGTFGEYSLAAVGARHSLHADKRHGGESADGEQR